MNKFQEKESKRLIHRKKVIACLRKGPRTFNQIKAETEIPQGSLHRTLKRLKIEDLAERKKGPKGKEGYWIWIDGYPRIFNPERLAAEVKHAEQFATHAKQLIPGFLAVLGLQVAKYPITARARDNYVSPEQAEELKPFAEEHLRRGLRYQEVNNTLVKYRELSAELDEMQTEECMQTQIEVYEKLSGQIGKIIKQCEFGHPLDGQCELCAEIAVCRHCQIHKTVLEHACSRRKT